MGIPKNEISDETLTLSLRAAPDASARAGHVRRAARPTRERHVARLRLAPPPARRPVAGAPPPRAPAPAARRRPAPPSPPPAPVPRRPEPADPAVLSFLRRPAPPPRSSSLRPCLAVALRRLFLPPAAQPRSRSGSISLW